MRPGRVARVGREKREGREAEGNAHTESGTALPAKQKHFFSFVFAPKSRAFPPQLPGALHARVAAASIGHTRARHNSEAVCAPTAVFFFSVHRC